MENKTEEEQREKDKTEKKEKKHEREEEKFVLKLQRDVLNGVRCIKPLEHLRSARGDAMLLYEVLFKSLSL